MKWSKHFYTSRDCGGDTTEAVFKNTVGVLLVTLVLLAVLLVLVKAPYLVLSILAAIGVGIVLTKLADKEEKDK